MAKAIEALDSGLTVGHTGLGYHGKGIGGARQQVHDGDTINVRAIGDFGIRFRSTRLFFCEGWQLQAWATPQLCPIFRARSEKLCL